MWGKDKQISNSKSSVNTVGIIKEIGQTRLDKRPEILDAWKDGRSRRRLKRQLFAGLFVLGNFIAVALVLLLVLSSQKTDRQTPTVLSVSGESATVTSKPLDQISSADIAVNLARLGNFEEVYQVAIQADSVEYLSEQPSAINAIADKPQVVNSTIRTRKDISTYVAADGDTVASIAAKYSVSENSIKWSNNISGNLVNAGDELIIPPPGLNGIVYTPTESDTLDGLARKYQTDKQSIISFNDIQNETLPVGEPIFLPEGQRPAPVVRTIATTSRTLSNNGQVVGGYTPLYGANGYVYGHCTYYVATRIGAPNGLGNARTWDDRAPGYGYNVAYVRNGGKPVAGGIAGRDSGSYGYGHVAVIEAVNADGTMLKYSDMNGIGGWNRVYYSDWVPVTEFDWFLY